MEQRSAGPDREVVSDPETNDDQPGREVIILFAVFFGAGLAVLSLILGWWWGHNPLTRFAWNPWDAFLGVLAALPLVGLFLLMLRWPIGPLKQIKDFLEDEFVPLLAGSSLSDMALIALSAGVGEEMLFRGAIQSSLGAWLGDSGGLVLSSLLFGMLHPISVPYIVATSGVGLALGGLYLFSGNLLTVMVTHAIYDFALIAYLLLVHDGSWLRKEPIPPVDQDADIDNRERP